MRIENANHMHAALVAKGMSCRSWAEDNGYNPRTVQKCIQQFAPDQGREPQRSLSKEIMDKLWLTIGHEIGGESE